jgi:hypothetical protein
MTLNTMTDKTELTQARADMLAVLDEKLAAMPEWRAFRAMDRAIAALNGHDSQNDPFGHDSPFPRNSPAMKRERVRLVERVSRLPPSYATLGLQALGDEGRPLTTDEMLAYIGGLRDLGPDPDKARINVQSSFSKDPRIQSIPWVRGRAWWFADREPPKAETAE